MTRAFTLVELLVVVTIIVVLLALLTPAMDRAIYQAELTVCGANVHGVARGGIMYASGNRRTYPHRDGMEGSDVEQNRLNVPSPYWDPPADMRPILRDFISINGHLNDPFCEKLDYDNSDSDTVVMADYYIWFNWRFQSETYQGSAMNRLGSRFTWLNDTAGNRLFRFNVLASDWTTTSEQAPHTYASHPDHDGVMSHGAVENTPITDLTLGTSVGQGPLKYTASMWVSTARHDRGLIDMNFALDDGSVNRVTELPWDEGKRADEGEEPGRVTRVPRAGNAGDWPRDWSEIPPAG